MSIAFNENCEYWALNNECKENPSFMLTECSEACKKQGIVMEEYNKRCARTKDEGILKPNTMTKIFNDIIVQFHYLKPELVSKNPPVIVFDKFISEFEADSFINYGKGKYQRSTGLQINKDGNYESIKTSIRTSANTWCQEKTCTELPVVKKVTELISNITNVPETNFEYAQLLYYHSCSHNNASDCSFYKRHHDYIDGDFNKNQGVRIYTLFIYLNNVEKGGQTVFDLGLSVEPKKGRAVLWPSVLEDKPHSQDPRTMHEALPVLEGEKYAVNFWIHQYDFKDAHRKSCTH